MHGRRGDLEKLLDVRLRRWALVQLCVRVDIGQILPLQGSRSDCAHLVPQKIDT